MTPEEHAEFDPWAAPLDELAEIAREIAAYGDPKAQDLSTVEARRIFAAHILEVLQARAKLEAAKLQREAMDDQTQTNRQLVHVTWWLVGVTALLAVAAIVALFLS